MPGFDVSGRRLRPGRLLRLVAVSLLCAVLLLLPLAGCTLGVWGRTGEIDWLANRLPRLHKNLFFQLPEAEYRAALADLRAQVDQLDEEHFIMAVWQILARLGDGHTGLYLSAEAQTAYGRYPLSLYWFADGLYVIAAGSNLAETVGRRVVAVDGMPVAEVLKRMATVVAKENDVSVLARAPGLVVRPEVLYGLGVAARKDRAEWTFARSDGNEMRVEIEAGRAGVASSLPAPMWWSNSAVIWHRYLEAERTLYIQYNSCQGDLTQATAAIVGVLDSKPVERIVFDMRRNGGGNSSVAQRLIETIARRPEVQEPGHLFVVVGRGTYSSAILNSCSFQRQTNAIFVGEPTAGKPNGFGEVKTAQLPHFIVHYSIKYFQMVAGDDPPSFVPDVVVMPTAEAFFAGRDPVLEAVLEYGQGK